MRKAYHVLHARSRVTNLIIVVETGKLQRWYNYNNFINWSGAFNRVYRLHCWDWICFFKGPYLQALVTWAVPLRASCSLNGLKVSFSLPQFISRTLGPRPMFALRCKSISASESLSTYLYTIYSYIYKDIAWNLQFSIALIYIYKPFCMWRRAKFS